MDICGKSAVYLPPLECTDCSGFESRLKELEEAFENLDLTVDKISFTISEPLACDAVVCEAVLCGSITTDATGTEVIKALKEHEGHNIVLNANGTEYTLDAYEIVSEGALEYRLVFDIFERSGQYIIEGEGNSITYTYVTI